MRVAVRLLVVVLVAAVALVLFGRYAPDGSWIQETSAAFLRALRMSWMIDSITE